jgi:glyceraldehyde 3-phosphate dehydrogenase
VDVVLECTGKFLTPETLQGHLDRGAKRVIVAAPVKVGGVLNIVVGVNHHLYDPAVNHIVTAASCTTNCLAPVVKVVHEAMGIRHGQITTLHNPTNTNLVVDAPHKDLRRARSAMVNLAPTSTGSATAIALIYPELKGKLNGHAVRVPVLNASLTDCVFELNRATSAEEVNALFQAAATRLRWRASWVTSLPLVSADYARDTRSSIVDGLSTMVTDGTLLKVYAWYDNEMGYACRMVDLAVPHADRGHLKWPADERRDRNYAIVTAAYWGFTLSDGALRMLVLLHFYKLGYSPFTLAFLFLLYEAMGIVANLLGGWLATRYGIARMLAVGLATQITGFLLLSALQPGWTVAMPRWPGWWWRRASAAWPRT